MISSTVLGRAKQIWNTSRLKFFKHENFATDKDGWINFENATSKEVLNRSLELFGSKEREVNKNKLSAYKALVHLPQNLINGCAFGDMDTITEVAESNEKPKARVQTYFGTFERPPLATLGYAVPTLELAKKLKQAGFDVDVDLLFMKNVTMEANRGFRPSKVDDGIKRTSDCLQQLIEQGQYAGIKDNINYATDDASFDFLKSKVSDKQVEKVIKGIQRQPSLIKLFTDIEKGSNLEATVRDMLLHYLYQDGMYPNSFNDMRDGTQMPNTDADTVYLHVGAEQEKLFYARRQALKQLLGGTQPIKNTVQYISNFGRAPYLASKNDPEVFLDEYMNNKKHYDNKLTQAVVNRAKGVRSEYGTPTIKGFEMIQRF